MTESITESMIKSMTNSMTEHYCIFSFLTQPLCLDYSKNETYKHAVTILKFMQPFMPLLS